MKLDKDSRKLSKQLFQVSFTGDRLDAGKVRAAASHIIASKPRHYVGILKEYQRLIRLEVQQHHATVESAAALDKKTSADLVTSLKAKYGSDLTTDFKVTPELLGGLRIKIGSDVFDGSVRERLTRLETQLTTA